jgi:hypothetical protein
VLDLINFLLGSLLPVSVFPSARLLVPLRPSRGLVSSTSRSLFFVLFREQPFLHPIKRSRPQLTELFFSFCSSRSALHRRFFRCRHCFPVWFLHCRILGPCQEQEQKRTHCSFQHHRALGCHTVGCPCSSVLCDSICSCCDSVTCR